MAKKEHKKTSCPKTDFSSGSNFEKEAKSGHETDMLTTGLLGRAI